MQDYGNQNNKIGVVRKRGEIYTMESGASDCWHMLQGTPVSRDVAIDAAQLM